MPLALEISVWVRGHGRFVGTAGRIPEALELAGDLPLRNLNLSQQVGIPRLHGRICLHELVDQTLVLVDELVIGQYGHSLGVVDVAQRVAVLMNVLVFLLSQFIEFDLLDHLQFMLTEGFRLSLDQELVQVPRRAKIMLCLSLDELSSFEIHEVELSWHGAEVERHFDHLAQGHGHAPLETHLVELLDLCL